MKPAAYAAWPPAHAARIAAREDMCAADPAAPMKDWVYEAPSIGFVLSGWFDYLTEGRAALAAPGAVLFGNAGEHFNVRHHDASGNKRLVIFLRQELLEEVADANQLDALRFRTIALPPGPYATRIFGWLHNIAHGDAASDAAEYALAHAALTAPAQPAAQPVSARDRKRIESAVRHIETCFAEPCSVQDLAEAAQLSRYHFVRMFSAVMGQSPNQYLINTRIRAAAERLRASAAPLADIALDAGFNDISHFYACFRAAFDCTPRQWRLAARH